MLKAPNQPVPGDEPSFAFFKEDSGKNIIVAFINEEWKTRPKIAYIVRFDSAHQILSVTRRHSMTPEEKTVALGVPKKRTG
jgi:hypothetical protein